MAKYHGLIISYKRNICVFVLIAQAVKFVIDWLRLFGNTSFYVTLITRTMSDISYFVIIQLALLYYIGIAVYMLQLDADPASEDYIVEPVFNNFLVDSVLNQYLLILGEFHLDGFADHRNTELCYAIFTLTCFLSMITILNMLIAIMSDTFDKVIEQKPTFALKNKL